MTTPNPNPHGTQSSKEIFSENLKRLMGNKPVSQAELARQLGVPGTTVSGWCRGQSFPRADKLDALASYFGIDAADLVAIYETQACDPVPPSQTTQSAPQPRYVESRYNSIARKVVRQIEATIQISTVQNEKLKSLIDATESLDTADLDLLTAIANYLATKK
ncbi:MAG: helix-turn-helix domain-containing protein [Lachnospiraceae bacterium]|nr:helix-turn-helix domain-containing protein [Lachnospiraceae bacterium]